MQLAAARLEQARATAAAAGANRNPQVAANANMNRLGGPLINAAGGSGNLFGVNAGVAYEVDVAGRLSDTAKAAVGVLIEETKKHFEELPAVLRHLQLIRDDIVENIALFIAHKWLPAGNRRLLDILPGIGVTLMLWLIAGKLFGDYLAQFAKNYVSTYAGLASVMVALVFLYMIASIFIYGGELNATIMELRKERRRRKSGPV